MRIGGVRQIVISTAIACAVALGPGLVASAGCYGTNEGVAGYRIGPGPFTGFKGNQGIRTDPVTVNGRAYAHPVQMDTGPEGGDFVAIGSYNGLGPDQCTTNYDSLWSVYVDGIHLGVYFCFTVVLNGYAAGSNPSFGIEYGWCPWISQNAWLMSFGGVLRSCEWGATSASILSAGLEVCCGTTTDYNIDVKYTNLLRRSSPSTVYVAPGTSSGPTGGACVDSAYKYVSVSTSAHNDYLGTLQ